MRGWRPRRRPVVWGAVVTLVATAAVVLYTATPLDSGAPPGVAPTHLPLVLPWPAVAVMFLLADRYPIVIQLRREAKGITLSEVCTVLALLFSAPQAFLLGRALGSVTALLVGRRPAGLQKFAFNSALATTESVLACAVFEAVRAGGDLGDLRTSAAAYAGCVAASVFASIATDVLVGLLDGALSPWRVARSVCRDGLLAFLTSTFGLLAAQALAHDPRSLVLVATCTVVIVVGFHSHARLTERHKGLTRLYSFTKTVGATRDGDAAVTQVLVRARELLHAEHAEAVLRDPLADRLVRLRVDADGALERETVDAEAIGGALGETVSGERAAATLVTAQHRRACDPYLRENGYREAVVVPLTVEGHHLGAMAVANRLGDVRTFERADVLLLETAAQQAATAIRNAELVQRLEHEALHDPLTGLPNRLHFSRACEEALARHHPEPVVVITLDLDNFTDVNETFGHGHGDVLLADVAARLREAAGRDVLLARLAADEFAFLLPAGTTPTTAEQLALRLLEVLDSPISVATVDIALSASAGLVVSDIHDDAATLLVHADVALTAAKQQGGALRAYGPELDRARPQRLALAAELRTALREGEVIVHVQPKVDLATARLVGVEALARWQHPTRGFVFPDEFIPVAESCGLIGHLTEAVLDGALSWAGAWRREGFEIPVAVNLSPRSLVDRSLVSRVVSRLHRTGVPAALLTLEITEGSVIAEPRRALTTLEQLRALGVTLSVDDFGTGYSSLSYLKKLPVQEVKIDKSFVLGMADSPDDAAIVRSIVDLGAHLGLRVVAEGVEDERAWDALGDMGCQVAQGYYMGRPMPPQDLLPWLAAHTLVRPPQLVPR